MNYLPISPSTDPLICHLNMFIYPLPHFLVFTFTHPPTYPSVCSSIRPSIHSFIHQSIHPSIHPFNHPSIQPSIHPTNCSFIHLPISIQPPVQLSVHLTSVIHSSTCLSIHSSTYPSIHHLAPCPLIHLSIYPSHEGESS